MATDKPWLQQFPKRVKPWIAVAVLLAIVLVGYYLFLGVRYGLAFQQMASLAGQIEQKSQGAFVLPDSEALELSLATGEQLLQEHRVWYSRPHKNDLMAQLSDVARESRVELISVTGADPLEETRGTVQYQVQPMTVNIQGDEPEDIYRFISLLSEPPPVATVSSISISGFDGGSTAQIRFLLFFLPEVAPENQEGER